MLNSMVIFTFLNSDQFCANIAKNPISFFKNGKELLFTSRDVIG